MPMRPLSLLILIAATLASLDACKDSREGEVRYSVGYDSIYIDSVPRGATVSTVSRDNGNVEPVKLGITPLVLQPSQASSKRFLITMEMEDYLKAISQVPELKKWADRIRIENRFGGSVVGSEQDFFDFLDTPTTHVIKDAENRLVAIGPIYDLDWPKEHRVVALFIPRDVKPSVFYPLMPPPGTFHISEDKYAAAVKADYHFSSEQAAEATGSLSRCGKYVTKVRSAGRVRLYVITAQRSTFVSHILEYND